jgi:hypothetical protein
MSYIQTGGYTLQTFTLVCSLCFIHFVCDANDRAHQEMSCRTVTDIHSLLQSCFTVWDTLFIQRWNQDYLGIVIATPREA